MENYYKISVYVRDVDDYILTEEECKKLSDVLTERLNRWFGFDGYPDGESGEVLEVQIFGGNLNG